MRGSRRKAREDALQVLYQLDMNDTLTPAAGLQHFERLYNPDGVAIDEFTKRLVVGVTESVQQIDGIIGKVSDNWRKERMPVVDRNILRLGAYELEFCDDIPATVSINEMVELAKQFGSENSAAFINGILDKIKSALNRPGKAP